MNQSPRTLTLRSLMSGPEGYGSAAGRRIQPVLAAKVASGSEPSVMRLSLAGVRRIDVTFAAEAIIAVIRQHLCQHGVCLTNVPDEDVLANIAAAAERDRVPVTIWRGDTPEIVGSMPVAGAAGALTWSLARPQVRAAELASALDISLTNASSKLKQLWEGGYLLREGLAASTGGNEFVYARIG